MPGNDLVTNPTVPLAKVNVTYSGLNVDLPQPVPVEATDAQIIQWATEAVAGGFAGMPAQADADFSGFVVERYLNPTPERQEPLIMLRPKVPFGT